VKRTDTALWVLLLLQVSPTLLIIADASGVLHSVGQFVVRSIPLPAPDETSFLINLVRFLIAYWFVGCLWVMSLGALAAVLYVAFDGALTKLQRLAWAISFVLGQSLTVILYCTLHLLGSRGQGRQPAT
jgi:hypothetical protein